MDQLKLTILSPERRLLVSALVDEVTLPTSEGEIQILPGHAPMVGTLETGAFGYKNHGGGDSLGVISSGFLEVKGDEVSVMAETLELRGEIDVERAKKAQAAAEQVLKDAELDEHKFKKYQLKLERAIIRQQLADKQS